jgi:hypothetical protein
MHKLIFIFSFFVLSTNTMAQPASVSKYFEGIVEYEIKSESYMHGVSDNELRERFGATLRLYFKNGNYMREYVDGAGYTLRKAFYLKDKNMMYDHNIIASPDTLYLMDPAEAIYESYKIKPGKLEKVLNYQCPSSVISARYFFQDTGSVTMTYYFAPELTVNPEWHKDMYVWKDVIKEHKSIAVKFIEDDPFFFKQTFTATKVLWQHIPDETFKIDPKLIQVKAPKL